jgi:hypothetical protein
MDMQVIKYRCSLLSSLLYQQNILTSIPTIMLNCFKRIQRPLTVAPTPNPSPPNSASRPRKSWWKEWQAKRRNKIEWEAYRTRLANEEIVADFLAKQAELQVEAGQPTFCEQLTAGPSRYVSEGTEEGVERNGNGHFTILVIEDGPTSGRDTEHTEETVVRVREQYRSA